MKIKVLVIRFSSIGDIILTSLVIRCLKKQVSNIEIHYLTKKKYAFIVEQNPYIDKVYSLESSLHDITRQLRKENYDYIVDLHRNIRSTIVKYYINRPRASFQKLNFQKLLLVKAKINKLPKIHIVDRYMTAAHIFGIENDGQGLDYFIPGNDYINILELPKPYHNGYIALVLGAKHKTKQIPLAKLIEICNLLSFPAILLGGEEEKEIGTQLCNLYPSKVINKCGCYNLNQSASIIKQALGVITGDTGLMHIAAAFNKKIASLWGNTVPEFGMYPYFAKKYKNNHQIFEIKDLKCRPCSKIGFEKCPKGHFNCMMQIDASAVVQYIESNNLSK